MEKEVTTILNTVKDLGGVYVCTVPVRDNVTVPFDLHLWFVNDRQLLVAEYESGDYGLYGFLGNETDGLEKDVEMLKSNFS